MLIPERKIKKISRLRRGKGSNTIKKFQMLPPESENQKFFSAPPRIMFNKTQHLAQQHKKNFQMLIPERKIKNFPRLRRRKGSNTQKKSLPAGYLR